MSDDPSVTIKELLEDMVEGLMEALQEQDEVINRLDQRVRELEQQAKRGGKPSRLRLLPSATVADVGHG